MKKKEEEKEEKKKEGRRRRKEKEKNYMSANVSNDEVDEVEKSQPRGTKH